MQLPFFLAALFALAASQVAALGINVTANEPISPSEFLNSSSVAFPSFTSQQCNTNCTAATTAIAACTDDLCLCSSTTVGLIQTCETCMFQQLIAGFRQPASPLEGQLTAIQAYGAACGTVTGANFTKDQITVVLPDNWDGPFGQGLSPAATGIVLVVATALGISLIGIVNTM